MPFAGWHIYCTFAFCSGDVLVLTSDLSEGKHAELRDTGSLISVLKILSGNTNYALAA